MLSLHTNASTLSTQNSMTSVNKALSKSMTNLGTGFRVNSAMDDAAGLQIATRLNAQSRGMQVAQKNTQNGISMIQTAEGAMTEINNMLLRMKDLATESANGTSSQQDRDALQAEYDALGTEISNILNNTTFAGANLFSKNNQATGPMGGLKGVKFQVGASAAETVQFAPASLKSLFTALKDVSSKVDIAAAPTEAEEKAAKQAAIFEGKDAGEIAATAWDANDAALVELFGDEATFDAAKDAAADAYTPPAAHIDPLASLSASDLTARTWTAGTDEAVFGSEANFNAAKAAAQSNEYFKGTTAQRGVFDALGDKAAATARVWDATADVATFGTQANFDAVKSAYLAQLPKTSLVPADTAPTGEIAGGDSAIIDSLTTAINAVGTFRSDMGAVANRLEHTFNNLGNMITNTEISKGRILDVDFAKESSNMVKNQMLMQTSTAMLKQSNSLSQMVGSLVQ